MLTAVVIVMVTAQMLFNSDLICAVHTSIVLVHLLVWKLVNGEDLCGFHCSGLNLDGSFATVGI